MAGPDKPGGTGCAWGCTSHKHLPCCVKRTMHSRPMHSPLVPHLIMKEAANSKLPCLLLRYQTMLRDNALDQHCRRHVKARVPHLQIPVYKSSMATAGVTSSRGPHLQEWAATGPCHQAHLTQVKLAASVRPRSAQQLLRTFPDVRCNKWLELGPDNASLMSRQLSSTRHLH